MGALWVLFWTLGFVSSAEAWLQVERAEYWGTGCPSNSVSVQVDPSGRSFSVLYDQMDSRVDAHHTQDRKTCKLVLKIRKPKNLSYQVESADFRGFVNLDRGVVAVHRAKIQTGSVKVMQQLSTELGSQSWQGPVSQSFYTTTQRLIENDNEHRLACLPKLNQNPEIIIETEIMVRHRGGNRYGQLTVDSVDGRLEQKYNLRWTNCGGVLAESLLDLVNRGRR